MTPATGACVAVSVIRPPTAPKQVGTRPKLTVVALVMVCVSPPPVAVTCRSKITGTVDASAVRVRMDTPGGVTVLGAKLADSPVGNGPTCRLSGALNPLSGVSSTSTLAELPGARDWVAG